MTTNSSDTKSKVIDFPKGESVRAQAAHWLAALDTDEPSQETLTAFRNWINRDERHRNEFEDLAAFWGDLNILTEVTPPRSNDSTKKSIKFGWRPALTGTLASFFVLFAFIFLAQMNDYQKKTYFTAVGEQKTIELPDKSVVFLNTNSQIVIAFTDKTRTIHLERGEALFDVAHNKDKPFEVLAAGRIVRAIGTAFSVYLQPDSVEVLVTEGIVEIAETETPKTDKTQGPTNKEKPAIKKKIRVKAGSQAILGQEKNSEILVSELDEIEEKLTWRTGVLTFDGEPLELVADEVSRYTNKKLIVPDSETRNIIISGVFKVGDTDSLLEALQLGFGIQAHHVNENVISLKK